MESASLSPEEKRVHQILAEAREGLDASALSEASGLSKLRLYRVLESLRLRGLAEVYPGRPVLFYGGGLRGAPNAVQNGEGGRVEAKTDLPPSSFIPPPSPDPGLYLVREPHPARSLGLYREGVGRGRPGLLVSRAHHSAPGSHLRLGTTGPSPRVERLDEVVRAVRQAGPGATVLVDGLEYLVSNHGFEPVLRMVQHLRETAESQGAVLLLPVDPRALEARQMALLEREAQVL